MHAVRLAQSHSISYEREQSILIKGKENMNRAFDGDVVVVKMLPEKDWEAPGSRLRRESTAAEEGGAEQAEDDSAHLVGVRCWPVTWFWSKYDARLWSESCLQALHVDDAMFRSLLPEAQSSQPASVALVRELVQASVACHARDRRTHRWSRQWHRGCGMLTGSEGAD